MWQGSFLFYDVDSMDICQQPRKIECVIQRFPYAFINMHAWQDRNINRPNHSKLNPGSYWRDKSCMTNSHPTTVNILRISVVDKINPGKFFFPDDAQYFS